MNSNLSSDLNPNQLEAFNFACPTNLISDKNVLEFIKSLLRRSIDMIRTCSVDRTLEELVSSDKCVQLFLKYTKTVVRLDKKEFLQARPLLSILTYLFHNMTDKGASLAAKLLQSNVHEVLIALLSRSEFSLQACRLSKTDRSIAHSFIGILYNIVVHCPVYRHMLLDSHLIDRLMELSGASSDVNPTKQCLRLQTASCLLLVLLVDEKLSQSLFANGIVIKHLLDVLSDALEMQQMPYFSQHGYRAVEIIQGLTRLACSDEIKRIMIENNALQYIHVLLGHLRDQRDSISAEELPSMDDLARSALELFLALIFIEKTRSDVVHDLDFTNLIDEFNSDRWSRECRITYAAVKCSLSTASCANVVKKKPKLGTRDYPCGHVMLSYQHSNQEVMLQVRDALINRGYRVWMDVDNMHGSFVECMEDAIKNAAAIVAATCQSFKLSPYCRLEMVHAMNVGVPIFALQLEPEFKPDMWLAGVLSATDPIRLDSIDDLHNCMNVLVDKLGLRGSNRLALIGNNDMDGSSTSSLFPQTGSSNCSLTSSRELQLRTPIPPDLFLRSSPVPSAVLQWSQTDVRGWLETSNLNLFLSTTFTDFNGHLLAELARLRDLAPASLSAALRLEFGVDVVGLIKLFSELARLAQDRTDASELSRPVKHAVNTWSSQDVAAWLTSQQIASTTAFSQFDGPMLIELLRLYAVTPASLTALLRHDLNLNLTDQLRLFKGLSMLFAPVASDEVT